jgi:hypothetical protein
MLHISLEALRQISPEHPLRGWAAAREVKALEHHPGTPFVDEAVP